MSKDIIIHGMSKNKVFIKNDLLMYNHFSKFSQIYAVPAAVTAAKCVFDFFLNFGIPLKFLFRHIPPRLLS